MENGLKTLKAQKHNFWALFHSLACHVCAPNLDLYAQEPFDQPDIPWLVEQGLRKAIIAELIPSLDICRTLPSGFNMEPLKRSCLVRKSSLKAILWAKVTFSGSFTVIHPTFALMHCGTVLGLPLPMTSHDQVLGTSTTVMLPASDVTRSFRDLGHLGHLGYELEMERSPVWSMVTVCHQLLEAI